MSPRCQPGILGPVPKVGRYISFLLHGEGDPHHVLAQLDALGPWVRDQVVLGLGASLVSALDRKVPGLRPFPSMIGRGVNAPATPIDLWVWLKGSDRGALIHQTRELERHFGGHLEVCDVVDAFKHGHGLDLTGYEDGTENPVGEDAVRAAIVGGNDPGLSGSSFVSVQTWIHDLDAFEAMPAATQDHVIGRRRSDNVELDDAPASAHVKRTAQESFTPEAFMWRRSMPWTDGENAGLVFVSFAASLDPFEAQLRRMLGLEDNITDALFRFTRPLTGANLWCPPVKEQGLDLRLLTV